MSLQFGALFYVSILAVPHTHAHWSGLTFTLFWIDILQEGKTTSYFLCAGSTLLSCIIGVRRYIHLISKMYNVMVSVLLSVVLTCLFFFPESLQTKGFISWDCIIHLQLAKGFCL